MKKQILFFRNDDVRDTLDESLIKLTEIFIKHRIPITHVVEPANVTQEVVDWLLKIKSEYPNIIEIGQHGYKHKLNAEKFIFGKMRKGEFGFDRNFDEQYGEMQKGKKLMDKYFGDKWYPIFTFPFGGKNEDALLAADKVGFKIINDHMQNDWKHKLFYFIGHIMRKNFILQRSVSWHLKKKPKTDLFTIDVNISFIKKYINSDTDCEFWNLNDLIKKTRSFSHNKTIGSIFHHRYHHTVESLKLVDDYLKWCKVDDKFEFMNQQEIYEKFN